MKQCTKCEETKELDEFHVSKSSRGGRRGVCKVCTADYGVARRSGLSYETSDGRDCVGCGEHKTANQFTHSKYSPTGLQPLCKPCTQERHLTRTYGITLAEYDDILTEQGGCCAICKTDTPGGMGNRFHVDHCHTTDVVRGLLCRACNTSLGAFKDDTAIIAAAITYLEKHR